MPELARRPRARISACFSAVAAVLVLSACWLVAGPSVRYPAGPGLAAFPIAVQCPPNEERCREEARRRLLDIALNLELPYSGPGVRDPAVPDLPGTLTVVYSGATFPWGASDGSTGTATAIAVDLAPTMQQGVAYAVLATPEGIIRYTVPLGMGFQLIDTLYTNAP